jgi:D-alanyl-D-alanine carboxypeptidase
MRFFAGIGTFIMIISATACVAFAVFLMLDISLPQRETVAPPHLVAVFAEETTGAQNNLMAEAASWIQVIPPREDVFFAEEETVSITYDSFTEVVPATVQANIPANIPVPVHIPAPVPNPAPPIPREYTALPFYIHENADWYASFLQDRPDLCVETVIWKVNAFVHVPFYSIVRVNLQENPLLVSPSHRLPAGFHPRALVPVNNDECHLLATPETVAAFREMRDAAHEAGYYLTIASAFRSAARQNDLWNSRGRRDGSTARAHHSEHQTGRALDLWGPGGLLDMNGPSPTGRWVARNAHHYGFIVRYRAETTHITGYIYEPWHITYVGTSISMYMYENNILSLEEFVGRNPNATPEVF